MQSTVAWAKAAEYAARAEEAFDERARFLFLTLRDSWTRVAHNWEYLEGMQHETMNPGRPAQDHSADSSGSTGSADVRLGTAAIVSLDEPRSF